MWRRERKKAPVKITNIVFISIRTLMFGIFVFAIAPTSVFAATYVVNSDTDAVDSNIGDGVCATAAAECTLRAAIQESNSDAGPEDNSTNDTITLPADIYTFTTFGSDTGEGAAAKGDLDITDASGILTINGAGSGSTTIDANNIDRVFHVLSGATLELNDLTVKGGYINGSYGGGIYAEDSILTIRDVVLTDNELRVFMSGGGGGIACYGTSGAITIEDSVLTANLEDQTGSSILGTALFTFNGCDVTVNRSTISNNSGKGGAVDVSTTSGANIAFTDTTFSSNISMYQGAAALLRGDTGTNPVEFSNVTFDSNSSTAGTTASRGGAVYTQAPVHFTNVIFYNNVADDDGGAVYVDNLTYADTVFAHVTMAQNSAGGDGGGLFVAPGGGDPTVTIKGSVIATNSADGTGNDLRDTDEIITSFDYSYLGAETDSANAYGNGTGNVSPTNADSVFIAALSDYGGYVSVQGAGIDNVTHDVIPEAECDDASGNPLTNDARGFTRPENTSCDMGAHERDQTNPVVSVSPGTDTIECSVGTWTDAGATVSDFRTGLTATPSGSVTEETIGEYTITYTSGADYDGNTGTNTRTVTVSDTTGPTITVTGATAQTITVGDTYTDAGATATDACDPTITVNTSGSVDTATAGVYTLTYSASDDTSNAAAQKTRTVTVEAVPVEEVPEETPPEEDTEDDTPLEEEIDPIVTVAANGKFLKVKVDGVVVDQAKIGKRKLARKYYKIQTASFYSNYTTVVALTTTRSTAKLTVFRLTDSNELKKKTTKTFDIRRRNKVALTLKSAKRNIIAKVGKGDQQVKAVLKLTKKGVLKQL